jgi:hypothetical protein
MAAPHGRASCVLYVRFELVCMLLCKLASQMLDNMPDVFVRYRSQAMSDNVQIIFYPHYLAP